ncbi:hypothetical protein RQP53_13635 [Paucibacter sp. APW11]|uniref:Lipoprotein n=1 Tax=Roseateles aquae TaxID=3077235 RepID=A0ABU3PCK2_9BURK|nr:hypothetical protein [Paucibacter sp. APW11]MDT9000310.1 hypothetical protein [Paucibacter sp. APW11]
MIAVGLSACQPSAEELAAKEARLKAEHARRNELCRDNADSACPGARPVNTEPGAFTLHKWNDQWFKVPTAYSSDYGMSFYWPSKAPPGRAPAKHDPKDWSIQLQIRSYDIPPEPIGYREIQAAERDGRIVNRQTIRPGLDRVEFFALHKFTGERFSTPDTVYVAMDRRDPEGQPPVLGCKLNLKDPQQAGGGAGFWWRDGIFVEVLIRKGNVCEDWPELFDEVIRVLNLTQKV